MPKPVHALVGQDVFLQLQALRELSRSAGTDVQRIDLDGQSTVLADVLDELRSFSMFAAFKMVVIREADEFVSNYREPLEKYLGDPVEGAMLVLRLASLPANTRIARLIAAKGQVHPCSPPPDLVPWIVQHAKAAHRLAVKTDAARLLADLVGRDLGRLDNELAKLALQVGASLDVDAVRKSVSFQREQEMWDLTSALAVGDVTEAMRRWRHMLELDKNVQFRAITWLGMWLEDVRTFLVRPTAFKNAWKYKASLSKFQENARRLGAARAGRLISMLTEIDRRSKSGLGEMADNVERFILAVGSVT